MVKVDWDGVWSNMGKMKLGRGFALGLVSALVAGLLCAALWLYNGRDNLCGQHCGIPRRVGASAKTYWLSDREVLLLNAPATPDHRAIRLDTMTGSKRPLDWTGAIIPRTYYVDNFAVVPHWAGLYPSPDKKRLLWFDEMGHRWIVADLDGSHRAYIPAGAGAGWPIWSPDSRYWLELGPDNVGAHGWAIIHDGRGAARPRRLEVARQLPQSHVLGMLDRDRILGIADPVSGAHQSSVVFYTSDVGSWRPSTAHWLVILPWRGQLVDVALAPNGKQIAWGVYNQEGSLPPLFEYPFDLFTKRFQRETFNLWISRANGGGMRRVGSLPAAGQSGAYDLQWLPGCSSVSLVYKGVLYVVPVEHHR